MFRPNDFFANFVKHKDFSKSSKFHVEIFKPANLAFGQLDFRELKFQCEAAELPGYNINTVDAKIYGVSSPVAVSSSFNDISLTFICAGDLWEKRLFDYWINYIVPINNYELRFKDEYVGKINITQFFETGEPSYIVSLWNAFPITLSPLSLNWGDDGIHKLSVSFKYDYWSTVWTQNFGNSIVTRPPEQSAQSVKPKPPESTQSQPSSVNTTNNKPSNRPPLLLPSDRSQNFRNLSPNR